MTEISRPWSGISPGDSGPYSSEQWQILHRYIIGLGGSRANIGPVLGSGTQPFGALNVQAQSPATTSIDVLPGSALVQGIAYINTGTVSFAVGANATGNPRIDTVVLQADYALQTVRLALLPGTAAATPSPPTLTQSTNVFWEIPIADIAAANGFTSITNANITPRHEWINAANGVYLDNVLNNSGGTLVTGDVVIWDTSADRAVTTTTTQDNALLAGVWVGRTANGSYGRVLRSGIGYANTAAAVTRGNQLVTGTVAKQALVQTMLSVGARLGMALETTSGAGLALCFINVRRIENTDVVFIQDQKATNTAPASITSGGWRTRELNTTVVDTGTLSSLASNQITLAAGAYLAWVTAACVVNAAANTSRLRLRNTSDGATLFQGSNQSSAANISSAVVAAGYFRITASKVVEVQQYSNQTGNAGIALNSGDVEVYASILLQRIGS